MAAKTVLSDRRLDSDFNEECTDPKLLRRG